MKAIVGLGNPGSPYKGTRHNVGFDVVDELARRASVGFESSPAEALMARWRRPEDGRANDVLLVKPLTFMNLSGQAVGELARYFKIDAADLIPTPANTAYLGLVYEAMRASIRAEGMPVVIDHDQDTVRVRTGGRPPDPPRPQ